MNYGDVDLATKTKEQLLARLAQLEKIACREGRGGEKFTDLFAEQYLATREINLILVEVTRRQLVQL